MVNLTENNICSRRIRRSRFRGPTLSPRDAGACTRCTESAAVRVSPCAIVNVWHGIGGEKNVCSIVTLPSTAAKKNQGTFFGGFSTILMGVLIFYYMGNELKLMAELKGYNLISSFTVANLTEIGNVELEDMGTLPFFSVHYKGK